MGCCRSPGECCQIPIFAKSEPSSAAILSINVLLPGWCGSSIVGNGSVDAVDKLCRQEVSQVLHAVRRDVCVVVATFSVVAEAVGMLQAQVQTLRTHTVKRMRQKPRNDTACTFAVGCSPGIVRLVETSVCCTHRVSGHQHRQADEWGADFIGLQPALDVVDAVEWTPSVSRVDGGEVAVVHCGPSLRFGQNEGKTNLSINSNNPAGSS
ncbi:hypothetical protein EYF80_006986 [Liparis tanakae]|uniref:Uncharacterized protein n=1 Tax=Liparis tanakae TaxID=230148 RepID=A0A4Z2IXN8_9TELE|nr:hypothetical protein EYF80_006986 [Liparis tanakae]